MLFSSLDFLFIFLPLFLLCYYLAPQAGRNWVLLLGSVAFYAYGARSHPWILLVFLGLALLSYMVALLLERYTKHRKLILTLALSLIFGSLLTFKYLGLFGQALILPLGMSFYSFQMAAYLIDVQQRLIKAESSLFRLLTILLMFPKLISGPLTPHKSMEKQLSKRTYSKARFQYGLQDFIFGLAMKCLLANQIGGLWQQIQAIGFDGIATATAWLGLAAFSLQLYFDFYGYSLMAIGLGRMLGFRLPKNFVLPYTARSMSEFWRSWHITLGRWFLDYVYIPLGGSRAGKGREILSLLVVWLLTGIWHGATPNFLLWGLLIFALIAIEKLGFGKFLEKHHLFSHIYLLLMIMLSWMLFAITDVSQIAVYLGRLFPFFGGEVAANGEFIRLLTQFGGFILAGIVASTAPFMRTWDSLRQNPFCAFVLLALFWASVYYLSAGLNDPFLYFSF